jgi:SET domain-containing protein
VENDAQVGGDFNEFVECNSKCGCGPTCINREMQRGLRTPLEMYKTTNKGWAVRTLVPIPRGRFVIEYVGEMLTQTVAHERGLMYDEIKRRYRYNWTPLRNVLHKISATELTHIQCIWILC